MAAPLQVLARKGRHLFGQHELKLLNVSVILYVCFGALVFHSIGEFGGVHLVPAQLEGKDDKTSVRAAPSLAELRLNSVRRMWNITNQLNILYESNWTRLVLEELVEFERNLMVTLEVGGGEQWSEIDQDDEQAEESRRSEKEKGAADKRTERKAQERRLKSIKRSFVHSIATITTIGSPHRSATSATGKLATVIYGALGIPLVFVSVSRTGQRAAHESINLLLVARHYCFSLPIHYLCCGCCCSCGRNCLRLLAWCCCCCCCCFGRLCCWPFNINNRNNKSKSPRAKCFSRRQAPKLKLLPKSVGRRRDGATRAAAKRKQAAYVIGSERSARDTADAPKSVRFAGASQNQLPPAPGFHSLAGSIQGATKTDPDSDSDDDRGDAAPDLDYDSFGLFSTTLIMLCAYLASGSYLYAQNQDMSIVEALYSCYEMLSMTKLPESFGFDSPAGNPLDLYKSLKKSPNSTFVSQVLKKSSLGGDTWESFAFDLVYFVGGLHLVAMCGHMARFWFVGLSGDVDAQSEDRESELKAMSQCNGQSGASSGQLQAQAGDNEPLNPSQLSLEPRVSLKNEHYVVHASLAPMLAAQGDGGHEQLQASFQQPAPQMSLAELFVVGQQAQQLDQLDQLDFGQQHQQQQISDMSLTSDRSSDGHSLCAHHQSQIQLATLPAANSIHEICGQPQQHQFLAGFHQLPAARQTSTMARAKKPQVAGQVTLRQRADFNGFEQHDSSAMNTLDTMSSVSSRGAGSKMTSDQLHLQPDNGFDGRPAWG